MTLAVEGPTDDAAMGLFSTLTIQPAAPGPGRDVPAGGELLARALRLGEPDDDASWAVIDGSLDGVIRGPALETARRLLAELELGDDPPELAVARGALLDAGAGDAFVLTARRPTAEEVARAWPRALGEGVATEIDGEEPPYAALALLVAERRAVVFGGMELRTGPATATATKVLCDLAELLGTSVTQIEETWDERCTFERLRAGEPVGGGRITFVVGRARRQQFLSYGRWFDFGHVVSFAEQLGRVGDVRLYPVCEHAAVVRCTADEARRLAIDWDLRLGAGPLAP